MRMKIVIMLGLIFISPMALAYDNAYENLNGTLKDNGDGTYTVIIDNVYGHQYTGLAVPDKEGNLSINVHDNNDSYYSGTGMATSIGDFNLNLQNDETGHLVPGHAVESRWGN